MNAMGKLNSGFIFLFLIYSIDQNSFQFDEDGEEPAVTLKTDRSDDEQANDYEKEESSDEDSYD